MKAIYNLILISYIVLSTIVTNILMLSTFTMLPLGITTNGGIYFVYLRWALVVTTFIITFTAIPNALKLISSNQDRTRGTILGFLPTLFFFVYIFLPSRY